MNNKNREIKEGNIIEIYLSEVDLSGVDNWTLTMVIVEKTWYPKKLAAYYLANEYCIMKNLYHMSTITYVKNTSYLLLNLENYYQN